MGRELEKTDDDQTLMVVLADLYTYDNQHHETLRLHLKREGGQDAGSRQRETQGGRQKETGLLAANPLKGLGCFLRELAKDSPKTMLL